MIYTNLQIENLTRDHLRVNFKNSEPSVSQRECLDIYFQWLDFIRNKDNISYNSFIRDKIFS
jgi:hypothetical protein